MTTNDRDELATLISTSLDGIFGTRDFGPATQDFRLADALTKAGYGKLADAWDEGRRVGQEHRYNRLTYTPCPPNPYRGAGHE